MEQLQSTATCEILLGDDFSSSRMIDDIVVVERVSSVAKKWFDRSVVIGLVDETANQPRSLMQAIKVQSHFVAGERLKFTMSSSSLIKERYVDLHVEAATIESEIREALGVN